MFYWFLKTKICFTGISAYWKENVSLNTANKGSHILLHICPFCPYTTRISSNLKSHVLTHTGEYPFVCSICNYKCKQKQNLKRHMLLKHKS